VVGFRRSRRAAAAAALGVLALALGAVLLARPRLEQAVRARLEREAARRGARLQLGAVQVGLWPQLSLERVRLEKPGAVTLSAERVDVRLRLWGRGLLGRARLSLGRATLGGPAGLAAEAEPTTWDLEAAGDGGLRARLRAPGDGLSVAWLPGPAGAARLELSATGAAAGRWLSLQRDGLPLADPGTLSGTASLVRDGHATRFEVDLGARGLRLASLAQEFPVGSSFGEPTDGLLQVQGSWEPEAGALRVSRWRMTMEGAALEGTLGLEGVGRDPRLEMSLDVERVDFTRLFRASGLSDGGEMGSATLALKVKGRLADAASFAVTQRLDFIPPRRIPAAIRRLQGDFVHEVSPPGGGRHLIDVSPGSPDFIPLVEVPPLFVRTLLLGEDSAFFGHPGLDLKELPSAVLTNWSRGSAARGASTITQQLAKNLFLTREKKLGRKIEELALALLLESALGKQRILEIYLNVIEWGPGTYGLRPAARRYFDAEPAQLTPAQMAFLVALIPGPVKYQRSFARGTVSPGFRPLMDGLLGKLRSVNALSEEEYQAALSEAVWVRTEG
jgi:penicillin-binding protein 1A